MDMLSLGKIAFGALVSSLTLSDIVEYQMNSQDSVIESPIDTVSIIVCALNESKFIEQCLQSLKSQSIIEKYPQYFELIIVDSGSTDNTLKLAKKYLSASDKIIIARKGKLAARNIGTDYSSGNIIVAADADCIYPRHSLNTLLKTFRYNADVVAVQGSRFEYYTPIPSSIVHLSNFIDKQIINTSKLTGQFSAFYKHLFYITGKFNENINQLNVKEVQQEEEYNFGKRLSQYGRLIFKLNAPCIHLGGERGFCRMYYDNDKCDKYKISIERFG